MSIRVAHSQKPAVADAVQELKSRLPMDHGLVLFFASPRYEPATLAAQMQQAFGNVPTVGCTTAGEIGAGKMLKGSVVAMALDEGSVSDVSIQPVDLRKGDSEIARAAAEFSRHFGVPMRDMSHEEYLGIVLFDGLSIAEERIMEALGNRTNVHFVGGSAGDDLKFRATHVFAGAKALSHAAVLILIKPRVPFEIIKTQSFHVLPRKLKVTRADVDNRTVYEFDGKPATKAYAEALGVEVSELPAEFMVHPLGLMVSPTEPFVRSPQQVQGEAVVFYCAIAEGMELSILEAGDVVRDTRSALAKAKERGKLSGIINFNCILRTLQLEKEGKTGQYGELFADPPSIGFSTYGEAYVGHINQTSTMLVFR